MRIRDLGYAPGIHATGPTNSILDVPGVHVSQLAIPTSPDLPKGSTATKGVTIICPRPPQEFYKPCHAGTFTFNGNGELTGTRQIADWGYVNTPIGFTNSLSLGTVFDGIWDFVMDQQDRLGWDGRTRSRHYGTPVVGETADWLINSDVRASRLSKEDVRRCCENLRSVEQGGVVEEGQRGGGAGMTCHMFAGGTGTASRKVGGSNGSTKEYTLGVLVQTNYGRLTDLTIDGIRIGKILEKEKNSQSQTKGPNAEISADIQSKATCGRTEDGSILVLIITDAPLLPHQLQRLARHATVGLVQVGAYGVGMTFSGDIFLALSTAEHGPEQLSDGTEMSQLNPTQTYTTNVVKNESIDAYFYACAEAVEEAILNSMVGGRDGVVGMNGTKIDGLPVEKVKTLLEKHGVKI